ncbi:hypothetical protein [Janibacter corallicola]|uniref:hypothetical protein n=1 Tax=Janibacter corallicola TaxID=415212 RepID=UPI0012EE93A0|nr:hypothetical protein [Janibacter corallicola]
MTEALGCLLSPGGRALRTKPFTTTSARRRYAVVPGTTDGLLVPLAPAACAAAGVAGHSAASGPRARWGVRALSTLARTGAARLAPRQYVLGEPQSTLLGHVEDLLGTRVYAAVHLGPPRANRKPVLHLMDRRGATLAFVKVGVNALTDARVRAETRALEHLATHPPAGLVVPSVLASGAWQGHPYAVLGPVPTGPGPADVPTTAMRMLADSAPEWRANPLRRPWWLEATDLLLARPDSETVRRLGRAGDALEKTVPRRGIPTGPTHGDFTPWNCFAGPRGHSVWDWERFAMDRPLGWDALHYAVSLARRHTSMPAELVSLRTRAAGLVGASGGEPDSATWVHAAYLWHRGVSAVRDGQLASGARDGDLDQWLLPELEALLADHLTARP